MADKLEFKNDYEDELAERHGNDALDKAMNAFWQAYHSEQNDVWQCVQLAIRALTMIDQPTEEPDLASRVTLRLLSEFDIAHPGDDEDASEEDIAAIIRDEISQTEPE